MRITAIKRMFLTGALMSLAPMAVNAGVWDDSLFWYNGGAVDLNGDGKFSNGEMKDVRHAGIPGSATHGGTLMNSSGSHNTVMIGTRDVVFPLQNNRAIQSTVLDFTAPAETNGTKITVFGNIVKIPDVLSVDDDTYSVLIRFRREVNHAWDSSYQNVAQFGRHYDNGRGISIALSNDPSDTKLYLGYGKRGYVDTGISLGSAKGEWHELAVMANGTKLVVAAVNVTGKTPIQRTEIDGIEEGALRPYDGTVKLGGEDVSIPSSSPGKTLFRGQIHMVSMWNRVLSENEVCEAFSHVPLLFGVGLPGVDGDDVFAGASGNVSMAASPECWRNFPRSFSKGDAVSISFSLDSDQTVQPQMIRLVPSAGSFGTVSVSLNGTVLGNETVKGGREKFVYVPVGNLREGVNTCVIARTDDGTGSVGFNAVQMAGSWQIGKKDNKWDEMQSAGNTGEDFYVESSRRPLWLRRVALKDYSVNIHLGDVLGRWGDNSYVYTWKCKKNAGDSATMVVKLNGNVVMDPVLLTDTDWHTYSIELSKENLAKGVDNVLRWENPSPVYYGFDYHEFTVRKNPIQGLSILIK